MSRIIQTDVESGEIARTARRRRAERLAAQLNRDAVAVTYRVRRRAGFFCWRVIGYQNVSVHRDVPADHPARERIEVLCAAWLRGHIHSAQLEAGINRMLDLRVVEAPGAEAAR